jgi:hypothetical protein
MNRTPGDRPGQGLIPRSHGYRHRHRLRWAPAPYDRQAVERLMLEVTLFVEAPQGPEDLSSLLSPKSRSRH